MERENRHLKKKRKHCEGKAKDKSKRRRDQEAAEIKSAADIRGNGEEAAISIVEEEGHKSKKQKCRSKGEKNNVNSSDVFGSTNHGVGKEQAEKSGWMAVKHCLEHAEGDTSKANVKKDKRKNKEDKRRRAETTGQKQTFDTTVVKEASEQSDLRAVNDTSKDNVKKDKKKKKEAGMTMQKQIFHTAIANLGSDHAKGHKVEGKLSSNSKLKKSKQKRKDGEPALDISNCDQIVTREDNKRQKEHSFVLEQSSQNDNTNKGENRETKKRENGSGKASPGLSLNVSAGGEEADVDGKNDKKKRKSKEVVGGGKKEKEKAARSNNKGKRVSFADSMEVFTIEGGDDEDGGRSGESKLVHGKRFTPEEDTILMEAMKNYAEMKQLGEKGLEMFRNSSKHPELKGCWSDIAKSLPHRPLGATYRRANVLLCRSAERKWTQEEYEQIRRFVQENGTDWKTLAQELGKSRIHVKDAWRRIKPKNLKKGRWAQEEIQILFDLVNIDLRLKARQEKRIDDHRVLKDNISWEAISDKMTTRSHKFCCLKWYQSLASPLVQQGIWADVDDYLLVEALQKIDAVCIEDVDWDCLLDHRSGEVCRQRWNQMIRLLGGHREKPFIEQVEVLSKRYCADMIEYRK